MKDQNPIDSLFRDALREAEVPAPDGVFQAVQTQLSVTSSAAVSGTSLLVKASIWMLAAGSLVTAVWWNADSDSAVDPNPAAIESSIDVAESPSESPVDEAAIELETSRSNDVTGSTSIPANDDEVETVVEETVPVSGVLPYVSVAPVHQTRPSEESNLLSPKPESCKGSAQGRLSDLAGGCVQFESLGQTDARALWRIDGVPVYSQSGSHCPDFGQRDRMALVLILRHSSGCVDSQVFWIQAPKLDIPNYVIPDVITPNGDGLNDQFYVEFDRYPEKYELLIFDQLNRLVFRSEDPHENWRAQCYQTPCPAGLYRVVLTTQFEGQAEAKVNRQPLLIKK
jgi:gliding motility-associated-like protein